MVFEVLLPCNSCIKIRKVLCITKENPMLTLYKTNYFIHHLEPNTGFIMRLYRYNSPCVVWNALALTQFGIKLFVLSLHKIEHIATK